MAITSITITQDNKTGNCDLIAIHNPVIFMIDVAYTLAKPTVLFIEVQDENNAVLGTFQGVEYAHNTTTGVVTYIFEANDILDAYMDSFDDFESQLDVVEYVEGITKIFNIRFYIDAVETLLNFVALHGSRQFGETVAVSEIYNNENLVFYSQKNDVCYMYWYNNSDNNFFTVDGQIGVDDVYIDYDDTPFLDENDYLLRGN
jgi:hypothetical protein